MTLEEIPMFALLQKLGILANTLKTDTHQAPISSTSKQKIEENQSDHTQ